MSTCLYKVLGQSSPAATTLTDLYSVPANTQTICSSITICNRNNSDTTYRISIAIGGAADSVSQYLVYDESIKRNSTTIINIGLGMQSTDKIRVYSGNTNLSFMATGVEII
jgi:hypothetical protein